MLIFFWRLEVFKEPASWSLCEAEQRGSGGLYSAGEKLVGKKGTSWSSLMLLWVK